MRGSFLVTLTLCLLLLLQISLEISNENCAKLCKIVPWFCDCDSLTQNDIGEESNSRTIIRRDVIEKSKQFSENPIAQEKSIQDPR